MKASVMLFGMLVLVMVACSGAPAYSAQPVVVEVTRVVAPTQAVTSAGGHSTLLAAETVKGYGFREVKTDTPCPDDWCAGYVGFNGDVLISMFGNAGKFVGYIASVNVYMPEQPYGKWIDLNNELHVLIGADYDDYSCAWDFEAEGWTEERDRAKQCGNIHVESWWEGDNYTIMVAND